MPKATSTNDIPPAAAVKITGETIVLTNVTFTNIATIPHAIMMTDQISLLLVFNHATFFFLYFNFFTFTFLIFFRLYFSFRTFIFFCRFLW